MEADKSSILWLIAGFLIGFFAIGIPHWQLSYSQVSLPSSLSDIGLVVVGCSAAALRAFGKAKFSHAAFTAGSAVPAAVILRVIVEVTQDPTSHNLWPFEIIIATAVGLFYSSIGALIGNLSARFLKGKDGER